MKKGTHENECPEVEGLIKEQAESFAEGRLAYPEFRVIFATIENTLKLIIEVHVEELGEESDFFSAAVDAGYFSEVGFSEIIGPMCSRLNKDIMAELAQTIRERDHD